MKIYLLVEFVIQFLASALSQLDEFELADFVANMPNVTMNPAASRSHPRKILFSRTFVILMGIPS